MALTNARWISLAAAVAITLLAGVVRAEVVARHPGQTDDDFLTHALGSAGKPAQLAQKVVRSTELVNGKNTLIGFVSQDNQALAGHLLIETTPDHYEHVQFPSCDVEGDTPQLLAVFFARTAKGGGRDLAVLCSWDANHADVDGTLYGAQFYHVKDASPGFTVEPLTKLNAKFETSDLSGVNDHGKRFREKAKFKTVAEVKKLLVKMGIDQ